MMALWARTGTARCLRSHSYVVSHRFLGSSNRYCGVARAQHTNASTRAAPGNSDSTSISPEHWKSVYRAFLLHVHPDFFHDQPKERAVNEKSLKVLSMHLDEPGNCPASNGACLVFFFKTARAVMDYTTAHDHSNDGHSYASIDPKDEDRPPPRKVMLPIASDRNSTKVEVRHLLNVAGVSPTPVHTPSLPPPKPSRHQKPQSAPTDPDEDSPDWNDWGKYFFGETPANRAWDEAAARAGRGRGQDEDTTSEGRQRTTGGGAASEEYEHSGGAGLGRIVATDAGRSLMRERRVSARNVRRLVEELSEKHGFGKFTFRCGWSKSNLVVALSSLLTECDAHRNAFGVPNFGGLHVVFREDPSVLHKGEIRLCPADVPAEWISVLRGVTPALLSEVEERSREVLLLEEGASAILRGARLSRGLSCSKSRYHEFLGGICMAGADVGVEAEATADLSRGDWSVLQCRVEEGFSRVSKVLDDGTIQIGSGMTLQTVLQCLEKNFASSAAAVTDTAHFAAAAAIATARCRQYLGLETIDRTRAVSVGQMAAACEALVSLGEGENGDVLREATAARRRLRGHCVRVVGARRGVFDGVTEDGEVAIPWNWAEEEGQERGGASWERRKSSRFC